MRATKSSILHALFLALTYFALALARDPYSVLGIHRGASDEDIRKAYKTLAVKWHPDKNPSANAKDKFMEVQKAYESLTGPSKGEMDDRTAHGRPGGNSQGFRAGPGFHGGYNFHFQYRQREPRRPDPIKSATVSLTIHNFGQEVLKASTPWLIQVYNPWFQSDSRRFSPVWESVADALKGIVKCGRINQADQSELATKFAHQDPLGRLFFRQGIPSIFGFPEDCSSLECMISFRGELTERALLRFVAKRFLRLPTVALLSPSSFSQEGGVKHRSRHKNLLLYFLSRNQQQDVPLLLQYAAREFRDYFSVMAVSYEQGPALRQRLSVTALPTVAILKEDGVAAVLKSGHLSKDSLWKLLEGHRQFELPQLRNVSAKWIWSRSSHHSSSFLTLLLGGAPSDTPSQHRDVLRNVQKHTATLSGFSGSAWRAGRLHFAWLDSSLQSPLCLHLLAHHPLRASTVCRGTQWWSRTESRSCLVLIRFGQAVHGGRRARHSPDVLHVVVYDGAMAVDAISDWIASFVAGGLQANLPAQFIQLLPAVPPLVPEEKAPGRAWELLQDGYEQLREWIIPTVEDLEDVMRTDGWRIIPTIVALLAMYCIVSCFAEVTKIPPGGQQQGEYTGAPSRESEPQKEQRKTVGEVQVAEFIPGRTAAPSGRSYIVLSLQWEDSPAVHTLAKQFNTEKRFRWFWLNVGEESIQAWPSVIQSAYATWLSETGMDSSGRCLLVWHPRLHKFQILREASNEFTWIQLEQILDGCGTWIHSDWPFREL